MTIIYEVADKAAKYRLVRGESTRGVVLGDESFPPVRIPSEDEAACTVRLGTLAEMERSIGGEPDIADILEAAEVGIAGLQEAVRTAYVSRRADGDTLLPDRAFDALETPEAEADAFHFKA